MDIFLFPVFHWAWHIVQWLAPNSLILFSPFLQTFLPTENFSFCHHLVYHHKQTAIPFQFYCYKRATTHIFPARLTFLHPEDFSSFRILSSQRILSGEELPHLILIPSALSNCSIMGHWSPGTIYFPQMPRQYFLQFGRFFWKLFAGGRKENICKNCLENVWG